MSFKSHHSSEIGLKLIEDVGSSLINILKDRPLTALFYAHPNIKNLGSNNFNRKPSSITPEMFSDTLIQILRGDNFIGQQNQIDLILSKEPFDVTTTPQRIPTVLALGTTTTPNVFIYQDPVSGTVIVTGTMTTTVADVGSTMTFAGTTANLNMRKATVNVAYTFHNKSYNVSMDTIRTADQ